jgi:glycerol-3-phosphate dehydrogenase
LSSAVNASYDFLIIGAGLVGCALARELAHYNLRVGVVEQNFDVGDGVSKGNSSILHTGFDAKPGSLEARLLVEGHQLWREQASELGVPIASVGALMLALDAEQLEGLDTYFQNADKNGVTGVECLSREQVLQRVPLANPAVCGGLWIPRESITCTFTAVIALAEHAAVNGVEFHLGERVHRIQRLDGMYQVETPQAHYHARWLVNSAGLWGDQVAALMGNPSFTITPRKGEFLILDKSARPHVPHILLPVPTHISKGILVAPTMNGNVLLGPTAEDVTDKRDLSVSEAGLARVRHGAFHLAPQLAQEPVVARYSGLRPVGSSGDYIIEVDEPRQQVVTGGIRSTGLSAALAIAREVSRRLGAVGALPTLKQTIAPRPRRAWTNGSPRPCYDASNLDRNPAFGRILCLCETVSEAEVVQALHAPIPVTTLDGIKKRTWATAGRCQGFYCTAAVLDVMSRELDVPLTALTKHGPGSEIIGASLQGNHGNNAATS